MNKIKETKICKVCKNEVDKIEYWESYEACANCVRKCALEIQQEKKSAHCPKCGEVVLGDVDGLCGACSGEVPDLGDAWAEEEISKNISRYDMEWSDQHGAYQDINGEWVV